MPTTRLLQLAKHGLTMASLVIGGVFAVSPACATPVTYYFSGAVTSTRGPAVGPVFNGSFTYDPATPVPPTNCSNCTGYATAAGAVTGVFSAGTVSSDSVPNGLGEAWNVTVGGVPAAVDEMSYDAPATVSSGLAGGYDHIQLVLASITTNPANPFGPNLSQLPQTLALSDFDKAFLDISKGSLFDPTSNIAAGDLGCLSTSSTACLLTTTTTVPEPASITLAGLALACLGLVRRRS